MPAIRFYLLAVLLVASPAAAQHGASPSEWRYWGGDNGATRYSPLDQIDRNNIDQVEIAWRAAITGHRPRCAVRRLR